jgi:hypothetical protein
VRKPGSGLPGALSAMETKAIAGSVAQPVSAARPGIIQQKNARGFSVAMLAASRNPRPAPPVYRPQTALPVGQAKPALFTGLPVLPSRSLVGRTAAPPVYRPAQMKSTPPPAAIHTAGIRASSPAQAKNGQPAMANVTGGAPPVYRPQAVSGTAQPKAGSMGATPVVRHAQVQRQPIAQARKIAPSGGMALQRQQPLRSPAGVVQRRYDLKTGQSEKDLLDKLEQIDGLQNKLGRERLKECLKILKDSAFYHGRVDVLNEQIVGLLYFNAVRVNRRFTDKWAALEQDIEELGHQITDLGTRIDLWGEELDLGIFKLAIIGAGSAAAYYIDTLGTAYDHSATLLIGGDDPWAERRGQGIDFINHAAQQINYPSHGVQEYSEEFVKRKTFAEQTKEIIEDAIPKEHRFKGAVLEVSRETDGRQLYIIRWRDPKKGERSQRAKKVVVATGAGPHQRTQANVDALSGEMENRVMDMDTFIRNVVPYASKPASVVVQGPNAAIDAVAAAHHRGWKVHWLIRSTTPQYLPGTRYSLGWVPLYKTVGQVTITEQGEQLRVVAKDAQKCTSYNHQYTDRDSLTWASKADATFTVDYFVYGIGQDIGGDHLGQGGAKSFLSKGIQDNLELIHHLNGRYSEVTTEEQFPKFQKGHAVGLRMKGSSSESGLEIIGASAKALVSGKDAEALNAVVKYQSADIVAYEQLGGIRSAMYGLNEYLPPDIGTKVDFSHADPTTLRAHIAIKYPYMEEKQATSLINRILQHRKTGHHPHGYTLWWVNHWEGELAFWNRIGRIRKRE